MEIIKYIESKKELLGLILLFIDDDKGDNCHSVLCSAELSSSIACYWYSVSVRHVNWHTMFISRVCT